MGNQFVAFMDERHGLGSWVAEQIAADLFRNPAGPDSRSFAARQSGGKDASRDLAARPVSSADLSMSLFASGTRRSFGAAPPVGEAARPNGQAFKTWTSPRATAQATAAAVVSGDAQIGVLPLYEEGTGFNRDTLAALLDFPQTVVGEYVADSNYVLAVPTDLIHEVDQAGFTDSFDASGSRAFSWTAEKQRKYRSRIGTVYASADAMRHCSAAIEGMRAKGIDVQQLPDGADAYREGLSRAAQLLDPDRQVETRYGAGGQERVSRTSARNHAKPLIGVLLAFDKALGEGGYSFDSDYQMLEAEMAGADRVRTSFIATTGQAKDDRGATRGPSADLAAVRRLFRGRGGNGRGKDQGPLRRTPGLPGRAADAAGMDGSYPYARLLFAVPTVGRDARDHSPVLARLADERLSYRSFTLDDRDGMPAIIAVDVPRGEEARLKPVLKALYKLPGARSLAVFPSVTPMVEDELRARPGFSPRLRKILLGSAVIAAFLAVFAALQIGLGV